MEEIKVLPLINERVTEKVFETVVLILLVIELALSKEKMWLTDTRIFLANIVILVTESVLLILELKLRAEVLALLTAKELEFELVRSL